MKKLLLFFMFVTCSFFAQEKEDAWLFFKDKPNESVFLNNPLSILSQRALDRRIKQQISLDSKDVPIDIDYFNQIKIDTSVVVLGKSKWLNALHIQGSIDNIKLLKLNYPFINNIEFANKSLNTSAKYSKVNSSLNHTKKFEEITTDFNYGAADHQIKMLQGNYLHENGYTGNNQIIAIIDAGFLNVNTLPAFKRIRDNNQILGGYNFADRNTDFYSRNSHGTHVLSTISGYVKDEFVGAAPDAKFYLFISEIAENETVLEETLWVEAAEKADSLGVDIINTSLGYTTFDNPNHHHTYQHMDGKTTFISRGAEIAASRGMLLVNSAGNSGNSSWKYIGAPADAASVITVGAVKASEEIAGFSSYGPTYDGRIKPEILAQGQNPYLIHFASGTVTNAGSGTSFSSPIMAGLIACLNQYENSLPLNESRSATKKNRNFYLKKALFESADKFSLPTEQHGYGIPDFKVAFEKYRSYFTTNDASLNNLKIYPNPTTSSFTIMLDGLLFEDYTIEIYTILGEKIYKKENLITNTIDMSFLSNGVYVAKISKGNTFKTLKLIKN